MTRWGIAVGLLCLMPTVVVAQTPTVVAAETPTVLAAQTPTVLAAQSTSPSEPGRVLSEGLWPPPARLHRSADPEGARQQTDAPPDDAVSPAASAPAASTSPQAEADDTEVSPFMGEAYRYQNRGVFRRLLADYAAIPLGIPRWSGTEWAWFGITVGVTAGLFLPLDNPLDQRFQNYLALQFPNAVPHLWSPFNDLFIFGGMFALAVGTLAYGHFTGQDPYVETFSLMLEALVLIQSLHISTKLLLSRDGPNNGTGHFINGPTWDTFERFPEGAPSGHTGTLFALATVISSYWENPWLSFGVYSVATVFASALVLDRYHYISDVLWGGSMGVAVGRYVVRHRSSRYRYVEGQPQRRPRGVQLTPFVAPGGPSGGAAGGALLEGEF